MGYLTKEEIDSIGFSYVGDGVQISDKAVFYETHLIEIGDYSRIDDFCLLSGRVVIGRNVHVAVYSHLAGGSEGIVLDDFSGIAYGCQIFTQSDDYSGESLTNPTVQTKYKKEIKEKIYIGKHCIIGANSVVMPGVTMAEGCSLGAQSLLHKSTEPWGVYFGVPAKKIKNRKKDLLEKEKEMLAEESSQKTKALQEIFNKNE